MNEEQDQRLAAWLDGALDPVEAAAFEAELARDPTLAARAASWRANDRFIAGALAPLADEPIAAELIEQMGLGAPSAANDNPPWWRGRMLPLGGAVAAALALVMVMAVPRAPQRDSLSLALDSTPALRTAQLADGRSIEPTLTVRASDGRWCREFRSAGTLALACRSASGIWQIEAEGAGQGPAGHAEIGLAAGAQAGALEPAYRRLGASDPLNRADEAALIARGWRER